MARTYGRHGKEQTAHNILVRKPKEQDHMENLDVDGKMLK
jgi:hypothetical protein